MIEFISIERLTFRLLSFLTFIFDLPASFSALYGAVDDVRFTGHECPTAIGTHLII